MDVEPVAADLVHHDLLDELGEDGAPRGQVRGVPRLLDAASAEEPVCGRGNGGCECLLNGGDTGVQGTVSS